MFSRLLVVFSGNSVISIWPVDILSVWPLSAYYYVLFTSRVINSLYAVGADQTRILAT